VKHYYALVSADGSIVRVTPPLAVAPANVDHYVWQQVPDDAPAHNPDTHEMHSPEFVMQGHRVVRRFQIRRKP
jgi:hypothetical protein